MNNAVPRKEAAVVNVLPAIDHNNRNRTTIRIKVSAALGTKTKKIAPIAEVTPQERPIERFQKTSEFQQFWHQLRKRMPMLSS